MSDEKSLLYSTSPAANQALKVQQSTVTCTATAASPKNQFLSKTSNRMAVPAKAPSPGIYKASAKTSISHPINITSIIPAEILDYLSVASFPDQVDLHDLLKPDVRANYLTLNEEQLAKLQELKRTKRVMGNFCLSSCPGKKVRLTGPVKGRPAVNRDLNMDFGRMRGFGITMLVCCLDDQELAFLGAPWPKYEKAAKENHLEVLRLPMVEGHCPSTLSEVVDIVQKVTAVIKAGHSVLAHCRGGVGRAGLLAGCWMMENLLCKTVERAVSVLRQRRSIKAIETSIQAEYLIRYSIDVHKRLDIPLEIPHSFNSRITSSHSEEASLSANFTYGSPSLALIADMENFLIADFLFDKEEEEEAHHRNSLHGTAAVSYPSTPIVALPTPTPAATVPASPTGYYLPHFR